MTISSEFANLRDELRVVFPNARVSFDSSPSGAFDLGVHVGDRFFVMTYLPTHGGIGVDEVLDDEGFNMGYRNWFADFASAREKLIDLLRNVAA